MRYLALGAVVCLCLSMGAAVQAQSPDPQLTAPITKFVDAFNKGDMAGAAATHAAGADLVIIDEVAPYLWRGAKALQTWAGDLEADAKKKGIADQKVTISAATRVERPPPRPTSSCLRSIRSRRRAWRCPSPRSSPSRCRRAPAAG